MHYKLELRLIDLKPLALSPLRRVIETQREKIKKKNDKNSIVGRKHIFEKRKIGARDEILHFSRKSKKLDSTVQKWLFFERAQKHEGRKSVHEFSGKLTKIVEKSSIFDVFCTFLACKIGLSSLFLTKKTRFCTHWFSGGGPPRVREPKICKIAKIGSKSDS